MIMLVLLAACGSDSLTPVTGCKAVGDMTPDCRFQNPEDLALIPGSQTVIISQFGAMEGTVPGSLATLDLQTNQITKLFPVAHADDRSWGTPNCSPPDQATFAPHGIDLERLTDGRLMLLVVNHGNRESIEFFEIITSTSDTTAIWRGCVEGPPEAYFNDVVAARNGGFWVTHMMPRDGATWALLKASLFGSDSGHVYSWQAHEGFKVVPGSHGPMPNGIEKSEDEDLLYINMYMAGEIRKLDLATGKVVGTALAQGPDNATWSSDGYLLVASHVDSFTELTRCQSIESGACGFTYEIVQINPANMQLKTLLQHSGAPLGGVTVALAVDDELILGTFAGDRIVRTPIP
ncbi:MAG: SMP-30/gluconolactonase/LRE family protein [Pseudomonadota bacterium]